MTDSLLTYASDYEGALACPACGFAYTHIDRVRAGVRREDRAVTAVELDLVEGQFSFAPNTGTQHSSRRHWLEVVINCEGCPGGTLVLGQHKGVTEAQFVPAGSESK